MKIRRFVVLGMCQILALVFNFATGVGAAESVTSEQYHMRVTHTDNIWTYRSYGNDALLKEEKDLNQDGQIDYTSEIIRIKNVTIETFDENFDGKIDKITFYYQKRRYILTDDNRDKVFDHLLITDDLNTPIATKLIAEIPQEISPGLLVRLLERHSLDEEKLYVLSENIQKHSELQWMLNKIRREAPQDVSRWEELFNKTREYLDLPLNDSLPLVFKFLEPQPIQNSIQGQAVVKYLHYFYVDPTIFKDIDVWLSTIDHEMIHAIQNKRIFESLNKNPNVKWGDFTQYVDDAINKVDRGWWHRTFQCPISKEFDQEYRDFSLSSHALAELEAYIHITKRGEYHNLLYSHHQYTFSDQVFARAYLETVRGDNAPLPSLFDHLRKGLQSMPFNLRNLPQDKLEKVKQHVQEQEFKFREKIGK